ncbi:MAG TPA: DNA cytosine methyltransferase [Fimbriimonas sp.]|nr:DNA cytosine methyltransferase [Fimbriimonas sp.]
MSATIRSLNVAAIDLFCGVGGKTHGFIRAGLPVIAGFDIDETCRFAYETNNPGAKFYHENISKLDPETIRGLYPPGVVKVLIGCAPCQPFSTYSRRYKKAAGSDGHSSRWDLLRAFKRLISEVRPEIVSAENVPELARSGDPAYLEFVEMLKSAEYLVEERIVKCADYGVPQTRERLVILASRIGRIQLPPPTHDPASYQTVEDAIGHLSKLDAGGISESDSLHRASRLSPLNLKRIKMTPEGGGWYDWPEELRLECHKRSTGVTYPSVYGRMCWKELAPTITTQCFGYGNGRFGHPTQHRAISLREAALLQTFPTSYVFHEANKPPIFSRIGRHIGNAVPVLLAEVIAGAILRDLTAATRPNQKNSLQEIPYCL